MRYACRVCAKPSDQRLCEKHRKRPSEPWSGEKRHRGSQAKFRKAVLERDAHRCAFIDESGHRCPVTGDENLRACHYPKPLRDYLDDDPAAFDPSAGVTLCTVHDKMLDPYAR